MYILARLVKEYNTKCKVVIKMEHFEIDKSGDKIQSISRTIRLKAELFDRLMLLSEDSGVSFNKIINQCITYALDNMKNEKK